MQRIYQIKVPSPLGTLVVESIDDLLVHIFLESDLAEPEESIDVTPCLLKAKQQLDQYFKGCRKTFDLPYTVSLHKTHKKMLEHLGSVPYGKTISYAELANQSGIFKGARVAGTAVAKNPLPILIPCHRVIHTNHSLGGYSLGGPQNKEFLLMLEAKLPPKEIQ